MIRAPAIGWILVWLTVCAFCMASFVDGYWAHRDCFDAEGRCFDLAVGVVRHRQSGLGWSVAGALSLVLASVGMFGLRRKEMPGEG